MCFAGPKVQAKVVCEAGGCGAQLVARDLSSVGSIKHYFFSTVKVTEIILSLLVGYLEGFFSISHQRG